MSRNTKKEMQVSKHKTKPIDFTGCNEVIAEHLGRGEAVLCNVGRQGKRAFVTGYNRHDAFPYKVDGNAFTSAEPIEIKTYWCKASEVVKWLEDNGWTPDVNGNWREGGEGRRVFCACWFHFCGTEADEAQLCHKSDAWFEER